MHKTEADKASKEGKEQKLNSFNVSRIFQGGAYYFSDFMFCIWLF